MKFILTIFLAFFLFSCSNPKEHRKKPAKDSINLAKALLPESEKRRILLDSIINGDIIEPYNYREYQEFYSNYYPNDSLISSRYKYIATDLYIANEQLINPNKLIDRNKWFRMYLYPTFYNPFILKIEQDHYNGYSITYKLLDTDAQMPCSILFEYSYRPEDTLQCYEFFKYLDDINFLNNKNAYPKCKLQDGNHWTFEYIKDKKYNIMYRADPEIDYCGSKEDYQLALNCLNIIKKSKFIDILKKDFNGQESAYKYLFQYPSKIPKE